MSAQPRHAGAAAIGRLAERPPLERRVIRCLRLWSSAPGGVGTLHRELVTAHGAAAAESLFADLEALITTTVRHARRPLLAHAPDCPCAGADECVFARFVALAAEGAREDAVLMAALMVRADLALCVAGLAESIGLGLMRDQAPRVVQ